MLNCNMNREFLGKDCTRAEIATCWGVLSYCRLKKALLSSSLLILSYPRRTSLVKIGISVAKFYRTLYSLFVRSW